MADFVGFSTISGEYGSWKLQDLDLVKQDLLNEFFTRKGERLMKPNLGFIGWDLLFEPLTDDNRELIIDDCIRIVNGDPRVELLDISVEEQRHGWLIRLILDYVGSDLPVPLDVFFDRRAIEG